MSEDQIVEHAVAKAYEKVPVVRLSLWQKICALIAAVFILGNTGANTYNYFDLAHVQHVQAACTQEFRQINAQNITAIDTAFNSLQSDLASPSSPTDISINHLRADLHQYTVTRQANDAQRAKETDKCK